MANEPTWIHGGTAPGWVTYRYATCQTCGSQWQILGTLNEDAQECTFCGAPAARIAILSEEPTAGGAQYLT